MKKKSLLLIVLFPLCVFSQTQLQATSGTFEGPSLNLRNTLKLATNQAYNWKIYNMTGPYGNTLQFWPYNYSGNYLLNPGSALTLGDNGNVGIGTNDLSQYKLDINGKLYLRTVDMAGGWMKSYIHWNAHSLVLGTPKGICALNSVDLEPGGKNECTDENGLPIPLYSQLRMYTALNETNHVLKIQLNTTGHCYFKNDGNVGINCENPQFDLDVSGTIHAKEVLIDNDFWCDFVFNKNYELPNIKDVENYIKVNGHLPNIPTTQEVKENGINVAEIQAKLLQKIEELTLYVIEQNKKIEELQIQIENK